MFVVNRVAALALLFCLGCSARPGLECEVLAPNLEMCKCDNGTQLFRDMFCDLQNDCGDWSDERYCPGAQIPDIPCDADTWTCFCDFGNEIDAEYVCDGDIDCSGGEDEKGCWNERDEPTSSSPSSTERENMTCYDCYPMPCRIYYAPYCD